MRYYNFKRLYEILEEHSIAYVWVDEDDATQITMMDVLNKRVNGLCGTPYGTPYVSYGEVLFEECWTLQHPDYQRLPIYYNPRRHIKVQYLKALRRGKWLLNMLLLRN